MDPNSLAKRIKVSTLKKKREKRKYGSLQGTYIKHTKWRKVKGQKKINQENTDQTTPGEKTSR